MASKTYASDHKELSVTVIVEGKADSVNFSGGLFTTTDSNEQAAIEGSELFRSGHIRFADDVVSRELLVSDLAKKQTTADSAKASAAKAAAELDAFLNKPKVLAAIATAAQKAADDAAAALAAFDKAAKTPVAA